MKKQLIQHSTKDMLNAFEYRLYQMKADSRTKLPEDMEDIEGPEDIQASKDEEHHGWEELRSKQVPDSDGFWTDYTLYRLEDGRYGCVFGDKDIYNPDTSWFDVEFDNEDEAFHWFNNYTTLDEGEAQYWD